MENSATARWLRQIRATHGLDQSHLARLVNRARTSITGYENGNPLPEEVKAILRREYPDVPFPKPILAQAQYLETIPYTELRYAGEVPATTWGDPLSADTSVEVDAKYFGRSRFGTKVIGDSCWPALKQGDLAIWESDRNPPHRKIVIAERFEDDGCTVKQLVYDATQSRDILRPINKKYDCPPDGQGWRATARLIGLVRKSNGAERTWYKPEGLEPRDLIDTDES